MANRPFLSVLLLAWLALALPAGKAGARGPAPCCCCERRQPRALAGVASWYGPRFHGRPMANGRPFDRRASTAAMVALPLGSVVRVTSAATGRSEVVTVTDRGPFVPGRLIDLSEGTAERLGIKRAGLARVTVEPVGHDPVAARYRGPLRARRRSGGS